MTSWRGERAERQAVEEIHLQRPPPGARWSGVLLSGTCFGVGTQLDTAVERAITHVTRQDRCRPALRAQQTLSVTTNELHLGLHGSAKRLHLQTSCSKLLPTVYCSSSSRNEKRRLSNSYYATTTMLTSCTMYSLVATQEHARSYRRTAAPRPASARRSRAWIDHCLRSRRTRSIYFRIA